MAAAKKFVRVRMLSGLTGPQGTADFGDVIEVEPAVAGRMFGKGIAQPVKDEDGRVPLFRLDESVVPR